METVRGNSLSKYQNRVGQKKEEEETNRREGKIKLRGQNAETAINTLITIGTGLTLRF